MNEEPSTKKKLTWKTVLIVLIGAALVGIGMTDVFHNDAVSNVCVQTGAAQATTGIVDAYPASVPALQKVADTLDAAVMARTTSTHMLELLVTDAVARSEVASVLPVSGIVSAVVTQINAAYESSDTEDKFLQKLHLIAVGIRSAAIAPAADDTEG